MDKLIIVLWRNWTIISIWLFWILVNVALLAFAYPPLSGHSDKNELYVPAKVAHSHHQIAGDCVSCHTPFANRTDNKCITCHENIYTEDSVSHKPVSFERNMHQDLLKKVDVTQCESCHRVHHNENDNLTTLVDASQYCLTCHNEIVTNKEHHHAGMKKEACSECHNYHDNTIAIASFVHQNRRGNKIKSDVNVLERNFLKQYKQVSIYAVRELGIEKNDAPRSLKFDDSILVDWQMSKHASAGVNCSFCHLNNKTDQWLEKPDYNVCDNCHPRETDEYLLSTHGIRIKQNLPSFQVKDARLAMQKDASKKKLTCNSCHSDHRFNTELTVLETCLDCHNDEHSLAYKNSLHFKTLNDSREDHKKALSGVSCATCHFPRESIEVGKQLYTHVQHNVNRDSNKIKKFARTVCLQCHSLKFSLNSLNDKAVLKSNFSEQPAYSRIPIMRFVKRNRLGR